MTRPSKDITCLRTALVWAERSTCARRKVGCVLANNHGHVLATGYNGPPAGYRHCTRIPCPGADQPSGQGLQLCEAIHAEANALLQCPDVRQIHTAYCTTAPCGECVKLLLNTQCRRIVFIRDYPHSEVSRERWTRQKPEEPDFLRPREWIQIPDNEVLASWM